VHRNAPQPLDERLGLYLGAGRPLIEERIEHRTATPLSRSMDTSQLPSQRSAGGPDPLRLRGTDREHRVKVCVLAPLFKGLIKDFGHLIY
jgi:hypothetical protein